MHINLFTAAIKAISERAEQQSTTKGPITLTFVLSNGDALTGTIETFDMNGLIVVKNDLGQTVYVTANDIVMLFRSV